MTRFCYCRQVMYGSLNLKKLLLSCPVNIVQKGEGLMWLGLYRPILQLQDIVISKFSPSHGLRYTKLVKYNVMVQYIIVVKRHLSKVFAFRLVLLTCHVHCYKEQVNNTGLSLKLRASVCVYCV